MVQPDITVVPASLNGSADTLLELAGLFQAGHPELEMTARVKEPAELGTAVRNFAEFGHDQYQDLVALLAALSIRLTAVRDHHMGADAETLRVMDDFLRTSTFKSGER